MPITPNDPANFTPSMQGYTGQGAFRFWCQKILPLVYDDSLSYYELLNKVVDYLNKVIQDMQANEKNVESLLNAYKKLQSYVNNYFSSLDVQQEINNKLDGLVSDGTFGRLINSVVSQYAAVTVVDRLDQMTNHDKLYVLSSTGVLYYWNGNAFTPSGITYTGVNGNRLGYVYGQIQRISYDEDTNTLTIPGSCNIATLDEKFEISEPISVVLKDETTDIHKFCIIYFNVGEKTLEVHAFPTAFTRNLLVLGWSMVSNNATYINLNGWSYSGSEQRPAWNLSSSGITCFNGGIEVQIDYDAKTMIIPNFYFMNGYHGKAVNGINPGEVVREVDITDIIESGNKEVSYYIVYNRKTDKLEIKHPSATLFDYTYAIIGGIQRTNENSRYFTVTLLGQGLISPCPFGTCQDATNLFYVSETKTISGFIVVNWTVGGEPRCYNLTFSTEIDNTINGVLLYNIKEHKIVQYDSYNAFVALRALGNDCVWIGYNIHNDVYFNGIGRITASYNIKNSILVPKAIAGNEQNRYAILDDDGNISMNASNGFYLPGYGNYASHGELTTNINDMKYGCGLLYYDTVNNKPVALSFDYSKDNNYLPNTYILIGYFWGDTFYINGQRVLYVHDYVDNPAGWPHYEACCFGDSITAGTGSTIPWHFWTTRLGHVYCRNFGVGSLGYAQTISGRINAGNGQPGPGKVQDVGENQDLLSRIKLFKDEIKPYSAIVLAAGTNDWGITAITFEKFKEKFDETIEYCLTNFVGNPIIVMTPIHRNGETNSKGTLKEWVDWMIEECKRLNVLCIDMYNNVMLHPDRAEWRTKYIPDGLHPNNAGTALMGKVFDAAFVNLLGSDSYI